MFDISIYEFLSGSNRHYNWNAIRFVPTKLLNVFGLPFALNEWFTQIVGYENVNRANARLYLFIN